MRSCLLLLFFCITCFAHAQVGDSISWYREYSGQVQKKSFMMHLHKAVHLYSGYYYFDNELPLFVAGEDSSLKGFIQLIAWREGEEEEKLVISLDGNGLKGNL